MNKFFCISILMCLSSMAVAGRSGSWSTKSGWKDESAKVKNSEAWKQPSLREDAKGQGWVSSEGVEDFQPQSIPTSWQKVQKQNSDWVKSSGWEQKNANNGWDKSALNPASQQIAKGLIVKHPVPSLQLSSWTESPLRGQKWDKEPSVEDWQKDSVIKSSVQSGWEKDAALKQWQQNQAAASSGWESKAASSSWEKNAEVRDAIAAAWQKESEKKSAAADAAAREAAISAWQKKQASSSGWEQQSASNGWQKESLPTGWEKSAASNAWQKEASSEEAWQTSSTPAWNDVPAGWEKEAAAGSAEWQKDATSSEWDLDSDFKAWQKETAANGWDKETAVNAWKNEAASNGWDNNTAMSVWYKAAKGSSNTWEQDASSTGWEKDAAPTTSGWNNNKDLWQSSSKIYNDKKARGPAPSKWNK